MRIGYGIVCGLLMLGLAGCQGSATRRTVLPVCREATLIEVYSPAEVMVMACGKGAGETLARLDARRSAVNFVLTGGTDPLLQTPEERERFRTIEQTFFLETNISRFIAWEGSEYVRRIRLPSNELKIEMDFRVNKQLIREDLVAKGIVSEQPDLLDSIGRPFIMVIPKATAEESVIELLSYDPDLGKAAEVIESFLTARRYDVVVPEQELTIADDALALVGGLEKDESYLVALMTGSDVYITYTLTIETRYVGNSQVKKAVVGVRAFETTTARLLGTETGYSSERPVSSAIVIEEAVSDAVDKVLSRVTGYWKDDVSRGIQLRIICSLDSGLGSGERETIGADFVWVVDDLSNSIKENITGQTTVDMLAWVAPETATSASEFFRTLRNDFIGRHPGYELRRVLANRKLLLLEIKATG